MTVQIVRFKEGPDVICSINQLIPNELEIIDPMVFEVRNTNLFMQNWLPISLMKGNTVTIDRKEILCIMDPKEEFAEYYLDMVNKMKDMADKVKEEVGAVKTSDSFVDILEAWEQLDQLKDQVKH